MKRILLSIATLALVAVATPIGFAQDAENGILKKPLQSKSPESTEEIVFSKEQIDAEIDLAPDERLCANCWTPLPGGMDHIANGTATRNAGWGTIRLRGAPEGAQLVNAYLFWGDVNDAASLPITQTVNFEGQPVQGLRYGITPEPCWTASASLGAYFADVTQHVPAVIDGDYQVDGFQTNVSNGQDPWRVPDRALPLSDGATLLVIYSHPDIPNNSSVSISLGPGSYLGTPLTMFVVSPNPTITRFTRFGADGQVGSGVSPLGFVTNETTTLNGVLLAGPGSAANDSDWNGADGVPLNQLWDTHTTRVNIPAAPGLVVYAGGSLDCFYPIAHVTTSQ